MELYKEFLNSNKTDVSTWLQSANITVDHFQSKSAPPKQNTSEISLKITTYAIVFLVALLSNISIIIVVLVTKSLRTKFNFYIVNLAIGNCLIPLMCMWLHLVQDISPTNWPLGAFLCRIKNFMQGKYFFFFLIFIVST